VYDSGHRTAFFCVLLNNERHTKNVDGGQVALSIRTDGMYEAARLAVLAPLPFHAHTLFVFVRESAVCADIINEVSVCKYGSGTVPLSTISAT